ncbi:MAG TPA: hypothetical protein VGN78_03200 [Solirubrobacteraceae bacterium]|nr:hypothetical protein [Solirubrobacteraceae bacterium]
MKGLGWRAVAVFLLGGIALLAALRVWQGDAYWSYSDGVYALTARLVLHGHDLYREVAAAQPPPVFYAGAVVLAVSDSLDALRIGLSAVDLATGALVLAATWRLTARRGPAVAAGLLALLTPLALHDHALLTPETLAAPLVMAAALLGARPGRAAAVGGALGALAAACKLAYALPAIGIAVAVRRRAYLTALLAAAGVLGAFALIVFGSPLVHGTVTAQAQTGFAALGDVAGLWAQAVWNLLPFAVPAIAAIALRRRAADPALLRSLLGALAGALLVLGTLLKQGSYLNVLVVAEPPALSLAAFGAVALWEARVRVALAAAAVGAVLGVVEIGSLLASPGDPVLYGRPLAKRAPGRELGPGAVHRRVALARACPRGLAYSGPPYLAFLARRRMPDDQPDQFILLHADTYRSLRDAAGRDRPRCP